MNQSTLDDRLFEAAKKAYSKARARFTNYSVGAALLVEGDIIISGCNVESLIPSSSICAERTALFSAISQGYTQFKKLVLVMNATPPTVSCGVCAQLLHEFAQKILITSYNLEGKKREYTLKDLLPFAHTI